MDALFNVWEKPSEYLFPSYKYTESKYLKKIIFSLVGKNYNSEIDASEYIMNEDNFFKMILIHKRALHGLPIIIMGETGCGKTALLRYLVETILL